MARWVQHLAPDLAVDAQTAVYVKRSWSSSLLVAQVFDVKVKVEGPVKQLKPHEGLLWMLCFPSRVSPNSCPMAPIPLDKILFL